MHYSTVVCLDRRCVSFPQVVVCQPQCQHQYLTFLLDILEIFACVFNNVEIIYVSLCQHSEHLSRLVWFDNQGSGTAGSSSQCYQSHTLTAWLMAPIRLTRYNI